MKGPGLIFALALAAAAGAAYAASAAPAGPQLLLPAVAITAGDIAIVINEADPDSVAVGEYYARARKIPPERVIRVSFPADRASLTQAEFGAAKAQLDRSVPPQVQAYALAWTQPYRVECMSITAAFAFGFDPRYCAEGCAPTKPSPYYDSDSVAPFRDHGLRPAMLLAARDVAEAQALIDRGVRSDEGWPQGKAYLLSTSDRQRNVRSASYARVQRLLRAAYPIELITGDVLRDRTDVMFYFTGLARVDAVETNRFVDGALADHLTSAGGVLVEGSQTSALEWLHAGATGSYGTALEPCNFRQKFPDIPVVMGRYLSGETLIEAYWKGVQMPGQGVFVGEPLARPFGGVRSQMSSAGVDVQTRGLRPGRYLLQAADRGIGPFRTVSVVEFGVYGVRQLHLPPGPPRVYRLVPEPAVPERAVFDPAIPKASRAASG